MAGETKDASDGGGYIFVKAIGEFDDDHGAATRRAHEATDDRSAGFRSELAENDLHGERDTSTGEGGSKGLQGRVMVLGSSGPRARELCAG